MEPTNQTLQPNLEPLGKRQVLRSRLTLVMLFICFTAPVASAYLALYTGWYQSLGLKNNGILITPPTPISALGVKQTFKLTQHSNSKQGAENEQEKSNDSNSNQAEQFWRLAYILPRVCDSICEDRLIQLRQTLVATGPYQHRVKALLIQHQPASERVLQWAQENKADIISAQASDLTEGLLKISKSLSASAMEQPSGHNQPIKEAPSFNSNHLYLLDPQNRILLAYPPASSQSEWLSNGKSILKDLKHLLKVSRIG